LLFDGSDLSEAFEAANCSLIDLREEPLNRLQGVSCTGRKHKFLCENDYDNVEVVDVESNAFRELDESLKFMKPLGNLSELITSLLLGLF
jgi:hypothetical protein